MTQRSAKIAGWSAGAFIFFVILSAITGATWLSAFGFLATLSFFGGVAGLLWTGGKRALTTLANRHEIARDYARREQ